MAKGSRNEEVETILKNLDSPDRQILVILIIPSHDKDEKELNNQDQWANAGLELCADLFGGATAFATYAGIYRDHETSRNLRDKPILIEAYTTADRVRDRNTLSELVTFLRRMGRETRQAAIAVVIDNTFHLITKY